MNKIIIIAIILFILWNICDVSQENFFPYHADCRNCGYLDKIQCGRCLNCGWCINESGKGMCVPGDARGPYFKSDCVIWRHPSQFHRYRPRFYGRYFTKPRNYDYWY